MTRMPPPHRPTRSPFWSVGMNYDEPWAAMAQTNTGLMVTLCGVDAVHAAETVEHWRLLQKARKPIRPHVYAVGAAVVDPRGLVTARWGKVPAPGQPSRWTPIMMLTLPEPFTCMCCQEQRWQGCWVAVDGYGCSRCLPGDEVADARLWPTEPPRPAPLAVVGRPRAPRPRSTAGRIAGRRTEVASPGQTRIA